MLTLPWRGRVGSHSEPGWGDLSTRTVFDAERPSPRSRFARSTPLQGRVRRTVFNLQTASTTSRSRGMNCPRFCCRIRPFSSKRAWEGRAPAGTRDPWAKCTRMNRGQPDIRPPRAMVLQFIVRGKKEQRKVSIPPRIIASSFRLKKARLPARTQRVFGFANPYAKTTVFHCRGRPRDFRLANVCAPSEPPGNVLQRRHRSS